MTWKKGKPKNNAQRTLTCRQCRVMVSKRDHAERMANWHTPGHPEHDCDGTVQEFDSKLEAQTWHELCRAFDSGRLVSVRRQVRYRIHCGGSYVGSYVADFVIEQRAAGRADANGYCTDDRGNGFEVRTRVIDCKGVRRDRNGRRVSIDTPLSRFKRKCVEAEYGVTVELWATPTGALEE